MLNSENSYNLAIVNEEKALLAAELIVANKELLFMIREKERRADELYFADKELAFQNVEKERRAYELIIANKELAYQNKEKENRAAELIIANKELVFQNREKEKRSDELLIANKELAYQNKEKENRARELIIANQELAYQNAEKEKRAEELIVTNMELKQLIQLNADKDLFISILAHDLRGPFTAFLGLSEILKDDARKLNIEQIEDIANNIHKSARNTFNLLEDILMWTKLQQGRIPFDPQIKNFGEIYNDVIVILNTNAKTKNITVKNITKENINIFADIDTIKTVLRNLVSNAIKFTEQNGSIVINAEENRDNVKISVSDNGVGISPENQKKLFDISQNSSTKGTANESGTGLGLLLCKEFVDKHGGKIWVESETGKGSQFIFILPKENQLALSANSSNKKG